MKFVFGKISVFLTVVVLCALMFTNCASSGKGSGSLAAWKNVSYTTMSTAYIRALFYDGSNFFAAGDNGAMARSEDGVSWIAVRSAFDATRIQAITFGGGTYVAVGDESKISVSNDGTNWTTVSGSPVQKILTVAFGNDMFVAGGGEGPGKIMYSRDGKSWTLAGYNEADIWTIFFADGKFIAGGTNGRMAYSTDGVTWTGIANTGFSNSDFIYAITNNGEGLWAAGGTAGAVAYSEDGINWTGVRVPSLVSDNKDVRRMVYGNGIFLTGGYGGIMMLSSDGVTWEAAKSGFGTGFILALTFGNGRFIVAGESGKMAFTE